MKKTLLAILAMAAALCASAETIELLTNGEGTTLEGWTNGYDYYEPFHISVDGNGVSWFESIYVCCAMFQSVEISASTAQGNPIVTASVIASATESNRDSDVRVLELNASGNTIGSHPVLPINSGIFSEDSFSTSFTLNSNTRTLQYKVVGYGDDYKNGPKYRNCSMKITYPQMLTFVADGTTLGTALYVAGETAATAPIASRNGDYTFLGYFTEDGVQVYDANCQFVQSSLSSLTSDVTLYAHWAVPEGSIAKLVYRGQLDLLAGGPAVNETVYTK